VSVRELTSTLIEGGVEQSVAHRGMRELARSVATPALRLAIGRASRAAEVASLQTRLRRTTALEVVSELPAASEFFARYWATNTPLLIRGFVHQWPKPPRWSLASLRERFGDTEIEIAANRDAHESPELIFAALRRQIALREFLDRVEGEPSNDAYLVARNAVLAGPLSALLDEVELPTEVFDPALLKVGVAMWLGPAGTLSKLHHDESNTMLCQVIGRKRVRLVPPTMLEVVDTARGFHAMISADEVAAREAGCCYEATLEAGDAVFIPVGWWHEVESLSPSLSLALVSFRKDNHYGYVPGLAPAARAKSGQ